MKEYKVIVEGRLIDELDSLSEATEKYAHLDHVVIVLQGEVIRSRTSAINPVGNWEKCWRGEPIIKPSGHHPYYFDSNPTTGIVYTPFTGLNFNEDGDPLR